MNCPDGEHKRSTTPNARASCVKCGAYMPPEDPEPALPELTEAFFEDLREALAASGAIPRDMPAPEFVAFRAQTMQRVHWGQREYGAKWREVDTIPAALEEPPDTVVYAAGEMSKRGRHGELLTAGVHSYLAYAALRRYMADRDH